jgi:integrase
MTLTRAEVDDLLEAAYGDPLEGLYVLAVTLGMREGELLGLRWQNVDLRARRPMPEQTLYSRRWIPLRKRAKIRPVSFHALRHTAATLALEDGQPPHVVAAMLGHASVATTLRLYAHVTHASTEALVDAIDARFGLVSVSSRRRYWTSIGPEKSKLAPLQRKRSAEKGNRTLTPLRAQRPERCVSTSSTTSARCPEMVSAAEASAH